VLLSCYNKDTPEGKQQLALASSFAARQNRQVLESTQRVWSGDGDDVIFFNARGDTNSNNSALQPVIYLPPHCRPRTFRNGVSLMYNSSSKTVSFITLNNGFVSYKITCP